MRLCLLLACLSGPAFAQCPPPPDIRAEESRLIAEAQSAPDEPAGQALSNAMWELWTTAPDQAAQALLDRGMAARASYDFLA